VGKQTFVISPCAPSNARARASARRLLKPVAPRYKSGVPRIYFRGDAGFASNYIYGYLEAEGVKYAIRLPANRVLQERIGHLLTRPVGRPPNEVRRSYTNFTYQAGSWLKPRRVVDKVEWHPGELDPRVGFIVTDGARGERRRHLQEARHMRAIYQGGQGRDQMDAAVISVVRRQLRPPPTSRARL
jgi:hypothetical protein